ncbi:MAG: hypothetical protein ACRCUP_01235 [Mycoplasmatales bacterium]
MKMLEKLKKQKHIKLYCVTLLLILLLTGIGGGTYFANTKSMYDKLQPEVVYYHLESKYPKNNILIKGSTIEQVKKDIHKAKETLNTEIKKVESDFKTIIGVDVTKVDEKDQKKKLQKLNDEYKKALDSKTKELNDNKALVKEIGADLKIDEKATIVKQIETLKQAIETKKNEIETTQAVSSPANAGINGGGYTDNSNYSGGGSTYNPPASSVDANLGASSNTPPAPKPQQLEPEQCSWQGQHQICTGGDW